MKLNHVHNSWDVLAYICVYFRKNCSVFIKRIQICDNILKYDNIPEKCAYVMYISYISIQICIALSVSDFVGFQGINQETTVIKLD